MRPSILKKRVPTLAARPELSWAHYRVLTLTADNDLRKNLEREAVRNGWTSR